MWRVESRRGSLTHAACPHSSHCALFLSFFFFSSRRRHTRLSCDWSSDVCSSDLMIRHTRLSCDWSSDVCSSDLHSKLKAALTEVIKQGKDANGGLGNQSWAAVVNRDGIVCAVVFTGPDRSKQWPGSRLIAAEKANTANALSLDNFALSTGNLYAAA